MDTLKMVATGLAGSSALTGLHQALRNTKGAPRVDLLGEQAIVKFFGNGFKRGTSKTYYSSMAGDIVSNSLYYGIISTSKRPVLTGILLGLIAGILTLYTPKWMGLNKKYIKSSAKKKYMTVGYYTFGGLVAGLTAKMMRRKS